MNKIVQIIIILALLVLAFFLGVKYSEGVRNGTSWLSETKSEEAAVPVNEQGESMIRAEQPAAKPSESTTEAPATANVVPAEQQPANNGAAQPNPAKTTK